MDEYLLMNQVKEELTYMSLDFVNELKNAKIDQKGLFLFHITISLIKIMLCIIIFNIKNNVIYIMDENI